VVAEVVVGGSVTEVVEAEEDSGEEEEASVTEEVEAEEEDSGEEEEASAVVVSGRQAVREDSVVVVEDGAHREAEEVDAEPAASGAEGRSWWSPTDTRVCLFAVERKMPWSQGTW